VDHELSLAKTENIRTKRNDEDNIDGKDNIDSKDSIDSNYTNK
jgi:hypothetical protein